MRKILSVALAAVALIGTVAGGVWALDARFLSREEYRKDRQSIHVQLLEIRRHQLRRDLHELAAVRGMPGPVLEELRQEERQISKELQRLRMPTP